MTQEYIQEEYRKCIESFEYWKDNYLMRKRTFSNWQEIVKYISKEFDISLLEALETYKKDRQKWVDWYNDLFIKYDTKR